MRLKTGTNQSLELIVAEIVAAVIAAVIAYAMRNFFNDNERLPIGGAFAVGSALFLTIVFCAQWFWSLIVSSRASFGLKPYPEVFYEVYAPWELWLSPILVTLIVYSLFVAGICIKCWPEGMSEEKRLDRTIRILRRYSKVMGVFAALNAAYVAIRWGQWALGCLCLAG